MLTYKQMDITTVEGGMVLHGCNCRGVMGSGVALAVKNKWPEAYAGYKQMCTSWAPDKLLGEITFVQITKVPDLVDYGKPLIVCNMFTQLNYGSDGKRYASPEAIRLSLHRALEILPPYVRQLRQDAFFSFPVYSVKVGCGLGGLDWATEVEPIYREISQLHNIDIIICSTT
jgi:O-acetyl-ADP-ribose deacetylase (regulator of RNase III)